MPVSQVSLTPVHRSSQGALKSNQSRPNPMKSPEVDAVSVKRPLDDQMYAFEIRTPVVQQDAFWICSRAACVAPVFFWIARGSSLTALTRTIKVESLKVKSLDTQSPKFWRRTLPLFNSSRSPRNSPRHRESVSHSSGGASQAAIGSPSDSSCS